MFRTPTKEDRKDIFDLYLGKVAHDPELDTPERRDEIARITNGYSPAMIDQICSMALTSAHHTGRAYFTWDDLVDAMTVIESGTPSTSRITRRTRARRRSTRPDMRRRAHVYRPEVESSRLSIRMRGDGSLGHHSVPREGRAVREVSRALMFGELIYIARRDGGRVRLLRRELERRRRRPPEHVAGSRPTWSAPPACRRSRSTSTARRSPTRTRSRRASACSQRLEDIGVRLLNTGAIPDPRKQHVRRADRSDRRS